MKRGRKKTNQKKIIEDIPRKQPKITAPTLPKTQDLFTSDHKEVFDVKIMSKVRVSINLAPTFYSTSELTSFILKLVPDAKRRLIYTQNNFLDKMAVINFKTGKIIKNLGPNNNDQKKHVLSGGSISKNDYCYRNIHFLNPDTLIAIRFGADSLQQYLVRINLKSFRYEDINLALKVPKLKDVFIFDHYPVTERGQIAVAAEIREILLIDTDKGLIKSYKHRNEIAFGVSYYPKRKWIIGEARMYNPHFLIFTWRAESF